MKHVKDLILAQAEELALEDSSETIIDETTETDASAPAAESASDTPDAGKTSEETSDNVDVSVSVVKTDGTGGENVDPAGQTDETPPADDATLEGEEFEIESPALETYEDMDFSEAEINTTLNTIGVCSDVLAGLEEFETTLEAILMDGGIDPQATVMLNTAFNVIHTTTGLPLSICMPSTEAYEDKDVKVIVTEGFIKTVADNAKRAWDAICKFIAKIVSQLNVFYVKYFSEASWKLKNVESLMLAVKKNGGEDSKTEITLPTQFCNQLSKNYAKTLADLAQLETEINIVMQDNSFGEELDKNVSEWQKMFRLTPIPGQSTFVSFDTMLESQKHLAGVMHKMTEKLRFTDNRKTIIGGCVIELVNTIKMDPTTKRSTGSLSITSSKNNTEPYPEKSQALTKNEIIGLLQTVEHLLKEVIAAKNGTLKRLALITSIRAKSMLAWDNLMSFKVSSPDMTSGMYQGLKSTIMSFQYTYRLINEPGATYQKQALRSCSAAYNLCVLSHKANIAESKEKTDTDKKEDGDVDKK